MRIFLLTLLSTILFTANALAGDGTKIDINIDGFEGDHVVLAYHLGSQKYVKDSIPRAKNGKFLIRYEEALDQGVYLILLPPENNFFDILVGEDQEYSLTTSKENLVENLKFTGSENNDIFYGYMKHVSDQRKKGGELNKELEANKDNTKKAEAIKKELKEINEAMQAYQLDLANKHTGKLAGSIIKASTDVKVPDAPKNEDGTTDSAFSYRYYKEHYFDNINLNDGRLVRTPLLESKINFFFEKLVLKSPDSVIVEIDKLIMKSKGDKDMFKYLTGSFLNKYAKSKIVGMDAIYVHMVHKYYANEEIVDWVEDEQRQKMVDNANTLAPLLIGKVAPNIQMQTFDKKPYALHDVDAKFTALIFWSPDCGHCKKHMPDLKEFHKKYDPQGVKIFSVCIKTYEDEEPCKTFIEEKDLGSYINVWDPYYKSRFRIIYDVKRTPIIYILDKDKKIVSKNIGIEQMEEVVEQLFKIEQLKKDEH